jgi:hypothetical protein
MVEIDPLEAKDMTSALAARHIALSWKASDPDGDSLLFSVLFSGDEGKNWRVVSYEQADTKAVVPLYWRPGKIRLRVVVTDGWRTRSDEVSLD